MGYKYFCPICDTAALWGVGSEFKHCGIPIVCPGCGETLEAGESFGLRVIEPWHNGAPEEFEEGMLVECLLPWGAAGEPVEIELRLIGAYAAECGGTATPEPELVVRWRWVWRNVR